MDAKSKAAFIDNLSSSVAESLKKKIKDMPEEWDGHELRLMLAEQFDYEVSDLMQNKRGARYRNYRSTVCTIP